MSTHYSQSGVNLQAGYDAVERIKPLIQQTKRRGVMGGFGAFGAMFDLSALDYNEPVLVSGTDGVGTKLIIAEMMNKHDTIGIDLVAMCVNDILAQGAEPLYFLDYIALGKNEPEKVADIVAGISEGCMQAGAALIGGETAEMPDVYAEDSYDLAGFTVGAVEKSQMIDGSNIKVGDVLIGLPSSGVHSNGFSLVRKILLKDHQVNLTEYHPALGCSVGEALLAPTRIYVKPVLSLIKHQLVNGISHITGGGFFENIPRMLSEEQGALIHKGQWTVPPIFSLLQELGNIPEQEMYNVFNMGIGMVIACSKDNAEQVLEQLKTQGEVASVIGEVTDQAGVHFQ